MNLVRTAGPILSLALVFVACDRDRDRTQGNRTGPQTAPSTNNATTMTNTVALNRIADARCAREAACDNIGNDKNYATTQACAQKIRDDMRNDLGAKDCPNGVTTQKLDACLASIKAESCSNVLDRLERLIACRTSELCATEKRTSS